MGKPWELIPIPPNADINSGLSPAKLSTKIALLGQPRQTPTIDCSPVTNKELRAMMITRDVGAFVITGLYPAVDAIQRVMKRLRKEEPDLYYTVRCWGVLCVRVVRGTKLSKRIWSSHAHGVAGDFGFGDKLDRVGDNMTQAGLLGMYRFFHDEAFYWGAEFSGNQDDPMHFEASDELLWKWGRQGLLGAKAKALAIKLGKGQD